MGTTPLRRTFIAAVLGLFLGSSALAAPPVRPAPVLTVAPMRGKGGQACAQAVGQVLSESMWVEPWDQGRSVEGIENFEALSRFVEKRGRALGAHIVLVGTLGSTKLILEAYDVERGALLNLARVPLSAKDGGRCAMGARARDQVVTFAERAKEAYRRRVARAAAASPLDSTPDRGGAGAAQTGTSTLAQAPAASATPPPGEPQPPADPTAAQREPAPSKPPPDDEPEPDGAAPAAFSGSDEVLRESRASLGRRTGGGPEAPATPATPATPAGPEPLVEVEPQVGISQRKMTFEGADGATSRIHQVGAIFTPGLRVRVRPFRDHKRTWLRPLSLELVYRQSPTFQSRRIGNGPNVDSGYAEVAGLMRYAFPVPGSRFVVAPELGAHSLQYSLRGLAGGAVGQDTPGVAYSSLLLGVGLEAALVPQANVRLSGAYLPVLSGGQVFGAQYYPNGSAWALRIEAALTVRVMPWLVIVVTGQYTGYSLKLGTDDALTAGVSKATDRTTGLRFGVRFDF